MSEQKLLRDIVIVVIVVLAGVYGWKHYPKAAHPDDAAMTASTQLSSSTTPSMQDQSKTAQLKVQIMKEGNGVGAENGQTIVVNYTGKLADGSVFDSSIPRKQPFTLKLGAGEVIPGWELGLVGMKVGEERQLTIPPELAYGAAGFPPVIPANATLTFDVTLLEIR